MLRATSAQLREVVPDAVFQDLKLPWLGNKLRSNYYDLLIDSRQLVELLGRAQATTELEAIAPDFPPVTNDRTPAAPSSWWPLPGERLQAWVFREPVLSEAE